MIVTSIKGGPKMKFKHKLSGRVYTPEDFDVITITLVCGKIKRVISNEHLKKYFDMVEDDVKSKPKLTLEKEIEGESKMAKEKKAPTKKKEKVVKEKKVVASDQSLYTLKDIAESLGITSKKARTILRANDVEKPEGRQWAWNDEKEAKEIEKILKDNNK